MSAAQHHLPRTAAPHGMCLTYSPTRVPHGSLSFRSQFIPYNPVFVSVCKRPQKLGYRRSMVEMSSLSKISWKNEAIKVTCVTVGVAGAMTVALPLAGFTTAGVASASLAAAWQSSIGNVAAGSLFSALQSAGALGGPCLATKIGTGIATYAATKMSWVKKKEKHPEDAPEKTPEDLDEIRETDCEGSEEEEVDREGVERKDPEDGSGKVPKQSEKSTQCEGSEDQPLAREGVERQ